MSQRAVSSHGLFLVPKRRLECVTSEVAAKGPVLVTWTAPAPKQKTASAFYILMTALAAPLVWVGHALFTGHRG
ncbi:hypothetical protein [Granulicella tundricola]|uniref:Uncharacterized protein n=1 Tax=Granulicella tundricola (strain ATCC BAA-1859 / DSM 23138 / MP5ACTX9) TaxID=1198114 RepID=E8X3F6_GRATM|nr:hypothetical protein [Granulicella tundricola]ADW70457.1 hypothetical protein AciX9_3452 [Granulicella tundricola MP5ACTX9]